jgi:RNA polymerase sigma-70 factor (ECF subfamily)
MNQPNGSDEWLMVQVAAGHREHLETLVRRHASGLLTYIHRMIGDRHRAEDLFQDVFLAVWQKRRTYRFPCTFRAWLFAIATNRCRESFRRARPQVAVPSQELDTADTTAAGRTPAECAIATETANLVVAAVARLPDQQRTVLVLRNWNGLPFAEIAEVVGCSEATARSLMHHALTAMRRHLEPQMRVED